MKTNLTSPRKRSRTADDALDTSIAITPPIPKMLRRLPHVFDKVLELPFSPGVHVLVQETSESLRFLAKTTIADDFRVHLIQIIPGVTKIQVRGANDSCDSSIEEYDINDDNANWRVRLPSMTLPEMAIAECIDGELVVTVPKVNLDCQS